LAILAIDDRGRQAVQQGRRRGPDKPFIKVGSWPGRDAGGGQLSGMINLDDGFLAPRSRLRQA
jgi:hypothetical protein